MISMLILGVAIVLLSAGLIVWAIGHKMYERTWNSGKKHPILENLFWERVPESTLGSMLLFLLLLLFVIALICSGIIIGQQVGFKSVEEFETFRIQFNNVMMSDNPVVRYQFTQDYYQIYYRGNNPWHNWFYNGKIVRFMTEHEDELAAIWNFGEVTK